MDDIDDKYIRSIDDIDDIDDMECILFYRFWDATCYERFDTRFTQMTRKTIAWIIGQKTHVDWIVHIPDHPSCVFVAFTCFEGELFCERLSQSPGYLLADVLGVVITREEADRILDLCWRLSARKIPYNFYDSHFIMPFYSPHTSMVTDISSESMVEAFCSQMAVVVLRECLDTQRDVTRAMVQLNSRTVSPETLFEILKCNGAMKVEQDSMLLLFAAGESDHRQFVKYL
jgi:hypothetical protein